MLAVTKDGAFAPADSISAGRCREARYRVGDHVLADLKRPRDPGQWRAAHLLAELLAENVDDFAGMDAHAILKGVQLESRLECEEADAVTVDGQVVRIIQPRSLSFGSMDRERFSAFWTSLCDYIAEHYFAGIPPDEVERMLDLMDRR